MSEQNPQPTPAPKNPFIHSYTIKCSAEQLEQIKAFMDRNCAKHKFETHRQFIFDPKRGLLAYLKNDVPFPKFK